MTDTIREELTPEQRSMDLDLVFDPIFVNLRKTQTVLGDTFIDLVNMLASDISPQIPEWMRTTQMHHIYSKVALDICNKAGVKTLSEVIASGKINPGMIICSTEKLIGTEEVYEKNQVLIECIPSMLINYIVEIGLSTSYITCDTGRLELSQESEIGIIGQVEKSETDYIYIRPLIMGAPTLQVKSNNKPSFAYKWFGYDYFENFVEDIDEFNKASEIPMDVDWSVMNDIPEVAVKSCFCNLLGDIPKKRLGWRTIRYFFIFSSFMWY